MDKLTPQTIKWAIIENISIYVLVAGSIVWSRTGWPLGFLLFANIFKSEEANHE